MGCDYGYWQRFVLNVEICQMNDRDPRKHIVKTHKNLAYKSESHMTRLFQMAGRVDRMTRKLLELETGWGFRGIKMFS